jgi:hypothetical protein
VGAVARSAVVLLNVGDAVPVVFVLPSAAIGVMVGGIAGATARPWRGAVIGALLSAVIFELFMLPCVSLLGALGGVIAEDADGKFFRKTLFYAMQMGVAGALAGYIGGLVGRAKDRRESLHDPANDQRNSGGGPEGQ